MHHTLSSIVSIFLRYLLVQKNYSKLTVTAYTQDLEDFTDFVIHNFDTKELTEIKSAFIRNWMASLKQAGLKSTSINRKISALKSFFKFCIRENYLPASPTDGLLTPKNAKKIPSFVDQAQMQTLLQQVEFPDTYRGVLDKLIIALLYNTGIRQAELLGLKLLDADFENCTIKVLGKGNKERLVPISQQLLLLMKEYIGLRDSLKNSASPQFFINEQGKPLYAKYVYNTVNKYLSLVTTLKVKSPHILRHSFATHLSVEGADINAVKDLLGHASLAATQVYLHNNIEQLKNVHKKAHPKS